MAQNNSRTLTDKALLLKIRKKILTTEAVLKKSIGYQLLNQKNDVKQKKRLSLFANDEKKKRRKQTLLEKVRNKAAVKTGIFDGITNFFVYSLLGFVFTKIMPFLPKLAGVLGLLRPAGDFLALIARLFMGAIGGFIETGYKVHEQLRGKHEAIKKLPVKQEFDSFQKTLANTLSDVTDVVYKIAGQDSANKTAQKPVKGAATGGTIGPTRGNVPVYKPPTRELKSTKQTRIPRKQNIPDTNIGKDVGGEAKVREFYRSPKIGLGGVLGIFRPKGSPAKKTPVDSISDISKTLRRRNQLFGDIASVGSDIALGQKPSKTVYRNTAKDVIELARFISERQEQKQRDTIFAMAYGGVIPNRATEVASRNNLVEMVSTIIERSVQERVNKAIGDFRQPIGRDEMLERNREKAGSGGISGPDYGTSEGATGISGGVYGGYSPRGGLEKEIYEYLTKEKKLSDIQALGLMANISRESSFRPGIKERGGTGVGLFQWSHGRRAPFMRAVPDWETNWKAQIDYALNEPQSLSLVRPGSYASKSFASAQEAADWWMREWERPADKISGSRKHSSYLKGVPRGPKGSAMFRAPETSEEKNIKIKGGILPSTKLGSKAGLRLHPKYGTYRHHGGNDYSMETGTPISVIREGVITRSEISGSLTSGYGNLVEVLHPDGSKSVYAHLAERNVVVGQKIKKGSVIGLVGSTGGSTGPHLHFEYDDANGNRIDNWEQLNNMADKNFRFGSVGVLPSQVYSLAMKEGKEGIIEDGKWKPKKWSDEEKNRYNITTKIKNDKKSVELKPIQSKTKLDEKSIPNTVKTRSKAKPKPNALQNAFNTVRSGFRKLTGFKRGGIVGNLPNIPSGYTSYENYGGSVIVAIQPVMVQKEVMIDNQIPIPFPMSSGVNNLTNFRG